MDVTPFSGWVFDSQALDVYFSGWMERISVRIIWTVEELEGVHFTKEGEVGGHNRTSYTTQTSMSLWYPRWLPGSKDHDCKKPTLIFHNNQAS